MKVTPLISIIVPIYNVEEYIRECVKSLLAQTYTNLDIILVNDGTQDHSIERIRDLAADPRITIVNQHNQGLSAARNTGLEHAKGRYVAFVDSDDKVKPNYIKDLYHEAQLTGAYIVRGSFRDFEGNIPERWVCDFNIMPTVGRKALNELLDQDVSFAVWSSLYKTSFLKANNLKFTKGILLEDGDFTVRAYLAAELVSTISATNYMYRIRPGSILTSKNAQRMSDSESIVIQKFIELYNTTRDRRVKYQIRKALYAFLRDWTRVIAKTKVEIDLEKSGFNEAVELAMPAIKRRPLKDRLKFYAKLIVIKLRY